MKIGMFEAIGRIGLPGPEGTENISSVMTEKGLDEEAQNCSPEMQVVMSQLKNNTDEKNR